MATLLARLALLEEQRGNRTAALEYENEALDWSRRLGMVEEEAQMEAIYARLSRTDH
jgi:hypothetical protein